jgi:hypothetical protein
MDESLGEHDRKAISLALRVVAAFRVITYQHQAGVYHQHHHLVAAATGFLVRGAAPPLFSRANYLRPPLCIETHFNCKSFGYFYVDRFSYISRHKVYYLGTQKILSLFRNAQMSHDFGKDSSSYYFKINGHEFRE